MKPGHPLSYDELLDLRNRTFLGRTTARLLATIDERDKTIAKLIDELQFLRSLFEEGRPSEVVSFWLNKSLDKLESHALDSDETLAQDSPDLAEDATGDVHRSEADRED